ncbi:FAD/NAD(P)-binding domain-containing protein [Plenodomus tracheiphilus IPT5]|uniref:FAD/NAD(P)-binding domain-containing protein n=1 Tax=Plenodomus tracheiphilus IPT5 TaxID=1408161 RepID=A0A6A7B5R4_9PLEO|nr:FAD/NAD(P)-binding domain-containing protein [Plenodomus tracheiphilus IPT5]
MPFQIIVVGAGPSGLLLSLMLAKAVTLVEMTEEVDKQPRATHYGSPAMRELIRAGVADDLRAAGFLPKGVSWRKLNGDVIATLDAEVLDDHPERMYCLPLDQLGALIFRHLQQQKGVHILFHHEVVGLGQDDNKAWIEVKTPTGAKTLEADYIVGCDGANSKIRRSLFGDWEFPGTTWDKQIVATNTYYDFTKFGWNDSNFVIHPEHWYMAARITKDGLWRVTYGENQVGLSRDELLERQPEKFNKILPGHPDPKDYKVVNFSPYKVHQRLAQNMRVGRVLLAADAAHLCNPFGGMGLTGGIVDVGGLYDCLVGIHTGQATDSILDSYDEIRRQKYKDVVNPISSGNFRRLFGQDPETALENDEFLNLVKNSESDRELAKNIQLGANVLQFDFTTLYNKKAG